MRIVFVVALTLAGCASNPPPPAPEGLKRPVAWAMQRCRPLPDIPESDGDPTVRRNYHKVERAEYVLCAAKVDELVRYVETVAPAKK